MAYLGIPNGLDWSGGSRLDLKCQSGARIPLRSEVSVLERSCRCCPMIFLPSLRTDSCMGVSSSSSVGTREVHAEELVAAVEQGFAKAVHATIFKGAARNRSHSRPRPGRSGGRRAYSPKGRSSAEPGPAKATSDSDISSRKRPHCTRLSTSKLSSKIRCARRTYVGASRPGDSRASNNTRNRCTRNFRPRATGPRSCRSWRSDARLRAHKVRFAGSARREWSRITGRSGPAIERSRSGTAGPDCEDGKRS